MRVLFTTFAAKSHMHAQVPLAWALRAAGHEVVVASQPDLVDDITRTGLTAVPVGEPLELDRWFAENENGTPGDAEGWDQGGTDMSALLDMSEQRPERLTWEHVHGVFDAMTNYVFQYECPPAMIDDLVAFARHWKPDLVIWDTMTFAGPIAAMASGAAHARLLFALDLVGSMRATFLDLLGQRQPPDRDDPLRTWLTGHLRRHGCEFAEEAVVGQWTIDPVPQSMRLPTTLPTVPVRYVPYNGQAVVPPWLHRPAGRRRVCLTLGVAKREVHGHEFASVSDMLQALGDLDVEVVATLNAKQLEALPHLPDNVRAVEFVPLNALLPTCSAIVHHGGSGTFQTALAHGVPQVIVPDMVWDTILKASALEQREAGLYVRDVDTLTAGELRDCVVRLLDEPTFAGNADRVRREIVATPSPANIVPVLEKLTAEHRSTRGRNNGQHE